MRLRSHTSEARRALEYSSWVTCCWGPKAGYVVDSDSLPTNGVLQEALAGVAGGPFPWRDITDVFGEWVARRWRNTGSSTQLQLDGHTQDKCCHIVGDLAHAYKDKQHGKHLKVLGEDLQEAEACLHGHGHKQHVLPTKPGKESGVTEPAGRRC